VVNTDPDVEQARVSVEVGEPHPTLFPVSAYPAPLLSTRDACKAAGLNWLAAQKLHETGWLSFDPAAVPELTPPQQAELRFLGALVAAGCDEGQLRQMLAGLRKPYAYRVDRICYDWEDRVWRLLPREGELKEKFERWLDELVEWCELDKLERLRDRIEEAIREVRRWSLW
jgi:hypothetical protein